MVEAKANMGMNTPDVITNTIIIGRIKKIHVHESVLVSTREGDKPLIDFKKLDPVCRLGGDVYAVI